MNETRLDSLLAQVPAPALPAGLAERVAAAASALPQEQRPASARRAARRDRRGAWLRRPLLGGAIALGLAFSGAVAATLAGVPLPAKVAAVIAQIPFVGRKAPEPEHAQIRHAVHRAPPAPAPAMATAVATASAAPAPSEPGPPPGAIRRMLLAQRIVARREAMGLPTPPVQQVEHMLHRRQMIRRWRMATPEQRQAFAAAHPRAAAMIEAQEARRDAGAPQARADMPFEGRGRIEERLRDATPEQRQAFLDTHPGFRARMMLRDATPEQRQAYLASHPRLRAMLEAQRARRQAMQAEPR